LIVWFRT